MEKDYKRQYRECPAEVKQKISLALRNRPKSSLHKQNISSGLKDYWKSVPSITDTPCDHVEVESDGPNETSNT